jgi:lipid-A-disaccharide synthase
MAEHLDSMAVIFPFERQSYADTALPVHFVGHPFVDPDYVAPVAYDEGGPVLLLPGSRRQAVRRIFPLMLAGFAEFAERKAVVLCPSAEVEEVLRAARPPANVEIRRLAEGAERDLPLGAAAVLTSSGTMSMHCALAAIPGAVVYRANPLTYLLGRWLVKIPYIGIANLLLQSPMYPEYIQRAAQPKVLARELQDCIHNPDRRRRTAEQSTRLRQILGEQTTGDAADWVLQNLG